MCSLHREEQLNMCSDEQLIIAFKQGQLSKSYVLSSLQMRHAETIYKQAQRILQDDDDAQDISQEVLIRVMRFLDRFDGKSKFTTWLYRITQNLCLTRLKKKAHVAPCDDRLLLEYYQVAGEEMPRQWEGSDIQKALGQLSSHDRNLLELRFYKELSMEELAFTLGVSMSACKMRFYRALERLKEKYQEGAVDNTYELSF